MMHLHVQLLGVFRVTVDSQLVAASAWRLRTAGLLVKALALAPNFRMHREQLMDVLWPDAEPETAATNLRYTLHSARRAFVSSGAETHGLLVRERELLLLDQSGSVQTDVAVFESAVADAWRTGDLE
ncbi:MAG: transcriptional regulator, partial [Chloroflexota bacterium]|nr:transcriptional regulator [Chloroflexota bacterium]